ncbi:S-layer homology domain-containing protein [Rossellomorea sp. KS-H15a]|uniref:S-layer homology domain-containing protein n=1 Tax=Rossellomorea sp. KS-H15a TaxID=2963940 RepID=UPI0020C5B5CE|nr:S-layer homology domain-containing protein [Rossellomorea sp. KS-H15a]UTE77355.1 S-layer homology domain-containing protein [Rossellomorea sp. KS-H15a]
MKKLMMIMLMGVMAVSTLFVEHTNASTWEDHAEFYSKADMKKMLLEIGNDNGIPPEIMKAIAYRETGGIHQFTSEGKPYISEDGGIGVMQITMSPEEMDMWNVDVERLKWDTRYNMEIGARKLLQKWDLDIPKINDHNKKYLEDWYFAVMAYNGLSKRNDPTLELPGEPYQESVYKYIRNLAKKDVGQTPDDIEINYPIEDQPDIMVFSDRDHYDWPTKTRTSQDLQSGDMVYTYNTEENYSNLWSQVTGGTETEILHNTPLEIVGGPFETTNDNNLYVRYKVKGNGIEGYIASANIVYSDNIKLFPDINRGEVARAVSYLQQRGIVNGHDDGTYKPDNELLRRHAAKLLVKALDLKLPEGYTMKATDMKPGQLGYEEMMIMEANGLMGVDSDLNPNKTLTRSQMAAILTRAFKDYYKVPTKNFTFTDQDEFWNYDDINLLANNGITVVDTFNWDAPTTRAHFALFLERTIKLMEVQQ